MRNDSIVPTQAVGVVVAASDIRLVEVQRISAKKTILFVVGGIVLAATWAKVLGTGGRGHGEELPDPEHMGSSWWLGGICGRLCPFPTVPGGAGGGG